MTSRRPEPMTPDSTRRLFVVYAVASLLPIVLLGTVMLQLLQRQAERSGNIYRGQLTLALTLTVGLLGLWVVLLGVSTSIARRLRQQAAENFQLVRHDTLTNLPNRARFIELATDLVAGAAPEAPVALALIDLDRFKEVNDALGHPTGDALLVALAERLKDRMREGDVVARLGGDEFGLLLPSIRSSKDCVRVLTKLRAALAEPLLLDGLPLALEASIGFAVAPWDALDTDALMICADVAMYVAKRQHVGVVRYQASYNQHDAGTLSLVAELPRAIRDGQLVLHYQPKACLLTGRITAVEALVRWQHPTRGRLFPDEFLPAAEQTELVEPLTRWVLRRAMQDLRVMDPGGQLSVAVNISARSLNRTDFADDVLDALAATRTDARRLILEVTETALLADPPRAAATLTRLHDAGVRISIDDFGAGQTSLSHLAALPVSELKIDKQFVLAMHADDRNAAIVRSVIELGHSLGFTVTAEGVENEEALADLARADCDLIQGFLLARPMSAGKLHHLLVHSRVADRPWDAVPA